MKSEINRNNTLYPMEGLFTWLAICTLTLSTSCKKLVDVDPPINSVTEINAFASDELAISVVTGMFASMSINELNSNGLTSISVLPGLTGDEFTLFNGSTNQVLRAYYTNSLTANNVNGSGAGVEFWGSIYNTIFAANAAIEGVTRSSNLTPQVKRQLLGESLFMRALCYFYLTNLFGEVPLLLTTDFKSNAVLPRSNQQEIYQSIIADLTEAKEMLSSDYLASSLLDKSTERVRPTKWAATSLLARVYLYRQDWSNAESQASEVIENSGLYTIIDNLLNSFVKNNSEAIWQLQPVSATFNTQDARFFVIPPAGPSDINPVCLSMELINSFEPGDERRNTWVDSVTAEGVTYFFPYKYKVYQEGQPVTEYTTVLRLAEQYLIRSEARAQLGDIEGAKSDLNEIRTRAGLPNTASNDKSSILADILKERKIELFSEWGHRWFDLKRTDNIDQVMNVIAPGKGGEWAEFKQWYPIPLSDITKAPNITQNQGY